MLTYCFLFSVRTLIGTPLLSRLCDSLLFKFKLSNVSSQIFETETVDGKTFIFLQREKKSIRQENKKKMALRSLVKADTIRKVAEQTSVSQLYRYKPF
jgi:hypothetical protein